MGRDVVLKDVDGTRAPGYAPAEIRALAKAGHPHVIGVYEFCPVTGKGDHDGDWAVLEWAPEKSLAGVKMPAAGAAAVAAQIASALVHLHAHGIVHCDIKPGNIVRAVGGATKLTDFGSAYLLHTETVTPQPPLSYTPAYAPPEIHRHRRPVPASDVYSLAATVHALVTGVPPEHPAGDLSALGPLGAVLAGMLAEDPAARPDAAEAVLLFQTISDGADPSGGIGDAPTIPPPAARPPVVPAQLPGDVPGFAGRAAELAALDQLAAGDPSTAVVISAVAGTAGVGKTALAIHWARRIADQFPDGQLYVNLRGFDPSGQIVSPADALRGFLDGLGVPPDRVPAELDAQTALYRSLLSGRRILVVLDNARDTHQIQPLLPGTPGCLVLVTSRNDLLDLIRDGARPINLEVLDDTDARQLLEQRLGADRTAAEPEAVDQIIKYCARLPLALAIVAARAAIRPTFLLAAFATELHDSHTRLTALAGERPDTNIRAVFSWSTTQLTPPAQRLFRLLGLHPGPDISAAAAASLAGLPPVDVVPLLAELTRSHLIAEHVPGRYTLHDLLRTYATEQAHATDTDHDRQAATERMLDHYLHTAYAAYRLRNTWNALPPITAVRSGVTPEELTDRQQAQTWFAVEHPVLVAIIQHADGAEVAVRTWQLALALTEFLTALGRAHQQIAVWQTILAEAQQHDEPAIQATAHHFVAIGYLMLGRPSDAEPHLRQSIELSRVLGDHSAEARDVFALGMVCERQGNYADALGHAQRAVELYRSAGHRRGEARALNVIGWCLAHLDELDAALTHCTQAIELAEELDNPPIQAETWNSIGYIHHHLHHLEDAAACYQRALNLYQELGDGPDEATTLDQLGDTQLAAGNPDAARQSWQQAQTIYDELGLPEADAVRTKLERLVRSIDKNADDNE